MGYKLLGYAVWQGGKWYLRRRLQGAQTKLAFAGAATAVVVAGIVVASRAGGGD